VLVAAGWIALVGTPLESQERRWFDQCLRWRLTTGRAPPVDRRLVHLDITAADLASLPTLESEYQAAAGLIRDATTLGAELLVFDVIYHRGSADLAQPIIQAMQQSRGVVLAEGLYAVPGSPPRETRVGSFPFLVRPPSPTGLINIKADRDGVHRRYALWHRTARGLEPSLALAAYWTLRGVRWPDDVTPQGPERMVWRELSPVGTSWITKAVSQPADRLPLLDFRSGWSHAGPPAFGHLTLSELRRLAGQPLDADRPPPLAGKVLFVAYAAPGVGDFGATPFGPHEPLVQLHSTMVNDLLQGSSHWRVARWVDALAALTVLLMSVAAAWVRRKRVLGLVWLTGGFGVALASLGLSLHTPWVIAAVSVMALWTVALVAELARRHSVELMQRLKLRATIGYYFSPRVLERVLAHPGSMEPQQVELTVLLTDLRNFTPLSERLGARGVFELCNRVFEAQTQAVLAKDATLEHFLGDQFLSYWGAPDPQPDAADRALQAAVALIQAMERLRTQFPPDVQNLFGYGVAVHAGVAMIGNKGSQQRMDYGVMGDLINSAARVESLTKHYGIPLLMTREAYAKLSWCPPARVIDVALPVGKSTPIEVLEVEHPLTSSAFALLIRDYAAAYCDYRQGRFSEARQRFVDVAQRYGDPASRCLARRCEELLAAPPGRWDGIYTFTTK
jgi:adenylate cyclase